MKRFLPILAALRIGALIFLAVCAGQEHRFQAFRYLFGVQIFMNCVLTVLDLERKSELNIHWVIGQAFWIGLIIMGISLFQTLVVFLAKISVAIS